MGGMRVWVTRDETEDGPLCAALRAHGLTPVLEPVLERRVVCDAAEALGALTADDWLILTSPFAIEAVQALDIARVPRVGVVGAPSARLGRSCGLRVELISPDGHGEGLFAELRKLATSGVVCYPRSAQAKVPAAWPGIELRSRILYDALARNFDRGVVERVDIIAVASPSAVNAIGRVQLPLASIGRITSQAIRELGMEPLVEAIPPSLEALAAAIAAVRND